jgi:hypothetical protein
LRCPPTFATPEQDRPVFVRESVGKRWFPYVVSSWASNIVHRTGWATSERQHNRDAVRQWPRASDPHRPSDHIWLLRPKLFGAHWRHPPIPVQGQMDTRKPRLLLAGLGAYQVPASVRGLRPEGWRRQRSLHAGRFAEYSAAAMRWSGKLWWPTEQMNCIHTTRLPRQNVVILTLEAFF